MPERRRRDAPPPGDPGERRPRPMEGVLGIFDARDAVLAAVRQARAEGLPGVAAFAPAFDRELVDAADPAPTPVRRWTLAGGVLGGLSGLALTIWTTSQWPTLIVGGKPLISIPPFLVIAFELTILMGGLATFAGFVLWVLRARAPETTPYDPRFSAGHFGLFVACRPGDVDRVTAFLRGTGAIECRVV